MFETIIDQNVLQYFFKSQPQQIPFGSEMENKYWNSFWEFLKKETHLFLIDAENSLLKNPEDSIFLNYLTSGRGEAEFKLKSFKKPYNQKLPPIENSHSLFFFDELNEIIARYRKNNGYIISNNEGLPDTWKRMNLLNVAKNLPVRERPFKISFNNWNELDVYLLPFTDVVIVDPFIFSDNSLLDTNLLQILIHLNKATPVKFNLTLITFEGNTHPKITIQEIVNWLQNKKERYQLKMNYSVLLEPKERKEHDRGIFMNYLRIKTGDSFNLFLSNGDLNTKGTEIDFHPLVDPYYFNTATTILMELANKVKCSKNNEKLFFGAFNNKLLKYDHLCK